MKALILTLFFLTISSPAFAGKLNAYTSQRIYDELSDVTEVRVRNSFDPIVHISELLLDSTNLMLMGSKSEMGFSELRITNFKHSGVRVKCLTYINENHNYIKFGRCNNASFEGIEIPFYVNYKTEAGVCSSCQN